MELVNGLRSLVTGYSVCHRGPSGVIISTIGHLSRGEGGGRGGRRERWRRWGEGEGRPSIHQSIHIAIQQHRTQLFSARSLQRLSLAPAVCSPRASPFRARTSAPVNIAKHTPKLNQPQHQSTQVHQAQHFPTQVPQTKQAHKSIKQINTSQSGPAFSNTSPSNKTGTHVHQTKFARLGQRKQQIFIKQGPL